MMVDDRTDFETLYRRVASFDDAGEEFERVIRRVYERVLQPGDTAVDVGAHSGKHTLPLALSVAPSGKVLAVEPIRKAFDSLEHRIHNARLDAVVTTVHGCVSSSSGTATFSVIPDHLGWSSLAPRHGVTDTVEIVVDQYTLDQLCGHDSTVRFVKIDVEGAEPDVIVGAEAMMARDRPVVHIEVVPSALAPFGHSTADVADPLREHGYRIFDLLGNDVTDSSTWNASSTVPVLADYIAVHKTDVCLSAIIDELSRSFTEERSNTPSRPDGLAPPPLRPRERPPAPAPKPIALPEAPYDLLQPAGVQSAVWPPVGFIGRSQRLVLGVGEWWVLNRTTGHLEHHDAAATVGLPIDANERLGNGTELRAQVDLIGYNHQGNATIAELYWRSTGIVTLVRSRRDRRVELLWLRKGQTIAAAGIDQPHPAVVFDLRVRSIGDRIESVCQVGADSIRTIVPQAAVGQGEFELSVGRRRHFANPDAVNAIEATMNFSIEPVPMRVRVRSEMSRVRRATQRGPRTLASGVVRRVRGALR